MTSKNNRAHHKSNLYLGLHVPRLAFLPCKERVESSILFGSTIFAGDYVSKAVFFGGVAEWSIAPVLKTGGPKGPVGSNPTASALK